LPERSVISALLTGPASLGSRLHDLRGPVERSAATAGAFARGDGAAESQNITVGPGAGTGGELAARYDRAGSWAAPLSTYAAQHIAQEVLSPGLYIDPHPAGIAAYRDVLTVIASPPAAAAGLDFRI